MANFLEIILPLSGDNDDDDDLSEGMKIKANEIHDIVFSEDFTCNILNSAVEDGFLSLNVAGEKYFCAQSFLLGLKNYLFFKSSSGSCFILEQRHKAVSEIIFPNERVVFKYDKNPSQVEQLLSLGDVRKILSENSEKSKGRGFGGVLVSYARPYHFFYDTLPAFISFYKQSSFSSELIRTSGLVCIKDKTFIDPNVFLESDVSIDWFENEADLNDVGKLYLKVGYPLKDFKYRREVEVDSSTRIIINSLQGREVSCEPRLNSLDFNLWIGVCTEKRSWHESKKGIQSVVDFFLSKYKKINLIVDGMTRPVGVERNDFLSEPRVKKEVIFSNSILMKYENDSRVRATNLIGETACCKILVAQSVDFFITNFLTDSMYPARFACAPGIGHGSYKAKHTDHVHPKTIILKSKKKSDKRILSKSGNWARQSYSIDPSEVIAELEILFNDEVFH